MTTEQFKNSTTEKKIEFLNPLIEVAFKMLQAGTLKKNVVRHLTNRGIAISAAENITDIACIRVDKFAHYKMKEGSDVVSKLDRMPKFLRTGYTGE